MIRSLILTLALALSLLASPGAQAHTLGVDRAELIEFEDGTYALTSKVPPRIAPAIRTPVLPERCAFLGTPGGERGSYAVTFRFTCESPLTADDHLSLPWKREGALLTVRWSGQEPVSRLARSHGEVIDVDLAHWLAGSGSIGRAAARYTELGIEHILIGIDHLLFVLALLFVVDGRWKLVKTITAFTLAHSITLALATLGYMNLPSAPVEAAIALSIVFLATEIIKQGRRRRSLTFERPWLVAFAFGLLHGLGFAGALSEIGLPPAEVPVALLFFNIGVELGQLVFVALVLFLTWLLASHARGNRPAALARGVVVYGIGTVATYWFLERTIVVFGA